MTCRNCGTDIGDEDYLSLCPKCLDEITKELYAERLRLLQPKPLMFSDATLRDWFAGQYLTGLAANEASRGTNAEWSKEAYSVADAMIAEREKGSEG